MELSVGAKKQTVAIHNDDDPKAVAENFCKIMQVNKEKNVGQLVANIQQRITQY